MALTAIAAADSRAVSLGAPPGAVVTPEMFGAKGDGRTNDTTALAAMAAHVNAEGGGQIVFRKTTYLIGLQRAQDLPNADYAFRPAPIMEFSHCSKPLVIRGNGARIKCAAGLRFGTFDPVSGSPVRRPLPNFRRNELASPYPWMLKVAGCVGTVEISDLELDGSLDTLALGGPWGDTGYQIPAYGLGLYDNAGGETVRNVYTHHHALDGLVIDGVDRDGGAGGTIENLRSEYNGRQGCSIVGGRNYRFARCRFNHTGRGRLGSSPGAGVDVEAESGKKIRNLRFENCEFSDNSGCGLVADSGDSAMVSFVDCNFVGTTSWSAWPRKPWFKFERCRFVGAVCNAFGDAQNPARATQFVDCIFRDDPTLSPSGTVYRGSNADAPIVDLSEARNVLFSGCLFLLTHRHTLPWSLGAIYSGCTMRQASPNTAHPRGFYRGANSIVGKVDLSGSVISGELVVNGIHVPHTAGA